MGPVPNVAKKRAKVAGMAGAVKRGKRSPDDLEFKAAQTDLKAANIDACIKRNLATAPLLSDDQRNKLAELLRPVRIGAVSCD